MFGDKNVVDSSMTPNGKIYKRYVALSFNQLRESIAPGIVAYQFIDEKINPSDELSKHWTHNGIWTTLNPILFWPRDTMESFNNDSLEQCSVFLVGVCFMFQFHRLGISCIAHSTISCLHGFG